MVAVLGGLGAALAFAVTTLCNSRASRLIDSGSLLAWVMLVGLVLVGPAVLLEGVPEGLDGESLWWLAVSGVGNVAGLLCSYAALRAGLVGLVAPIISTEGAIAALFAVAAGETLTAAAGVALALIAFGVALAGASPDDPDKPARRRGEPQVVLLAVGAAVAFGASLYATGRVGKDVPVVWALLPPRLLGVVAIATPLILRGRLRLTRRALPFVVASGFCEVVGVICFVLGARHGIAVSSVLASQFAAISAVAAYVLFHERLARVQMVGVATVLIGVGALSGLQA
jgi:drug/metabolite transporter (DMT)-like permease